VHVSSSFLHSPKRLRAHERTKDNMTYQRKNTTHILVTVGVLELQCMHNMSGRTHVCTAEPAHKRKAHRKLSAEFSVQRYTMHVALLLVAIYACPDVSAVSLMA
jgi:hypothetical protein